MMLFALLAAAATEPAAVVALPSASEADIALMRPVDIKTHNAKYAKTDPMYIRCRRMAPTGSLIASTNVCRTNAQWAKADVRGNDDARATAEAMASKAVNSN